MFIRKGSLLKRRPRRDGRCTKSSKKSFKRKMLSRAKATTHPLFSLKVLLLAPTQGCQSRKAPKDRRLQHLSKSQRPLSNLKRKRPKSQKLKLWKICKRLALTTVIALRSMTGHKPSKRSLCRSRSLRALRQRWWTSKSSQKSYS